MSSALVRQARQRRRNNFLSFEHDLQRRHRWHHVTGKTATATKAASKAGTTIASAAKDGAGRARVRRDQQARRVHPATAAGRKAMAMAAARVGRTGARAASNR